MQEFKPVKEGKVREVYDTGDNLVIVATDRISAFDVILKNKVPHKGEVLTGLSRDQKQLLKQFNDTLTDRNYMKSSQFFQKIKNLFK